MTSAWLVEYFVDGPHPQPLLPLGNGIVWNSMHTLRALPLSRLNKPDRLSNRQHMETSGCEKNMCSVARIPFLVFMSKPGPLP